MKSAVLLVIAFLLPLLAEGHPGKTDRFGGHRCLKGCEEWELFYKEYHLHDKDWKPIRVGNKKLGEKPDAPVLVEPGSGLTEAAAPKTITTYRYVTTIREENVFLSNPLLYILLILLLLLLILRMNRKRDET
jgi:hypothetical protein